MVMAAVATLDGTTKTTFDYSCPEVRAIRMFCEFW